VTSAPDQTATPPARRSVRELVLLGTALCLLCGLLTVMSRQFADHVPGVERPIPAVLGLLLIAFAVYVRSLRVAIRCPDSRRTISVIVLFSAAFRGVLLGSEPIQEIDIYRYIWDGAAVTAGVNPFRYSPEQVRAISRIRSPQSRLEHLPDDLARLTALRDSSPSLATILDRIHYPELPTVYPPVSQVVFATAVLTTPRTATVRTYVIVMKAWLLLFDLGIVWMLLLLLRHTGRSLGWAVAYGWCPLVLKEFANSGHLDVIAVFLTTSAIYAAVRTFFPNSAQQTDRPRDTRAALMMGMLSAALLGLGVGAKLYPLVLAPLLLVVSLRRTGWRRSVLPSVTFAAVALFTCLPMLSARSSMPSRGDASPQVEPMVLGPMVLGPMVPDQPPLPGETPVIAVDSIDVSPQNPSHGIKTFLERWEMNDFLFMLLIENLNPPTEPDSVSPTEPDSMSPAEPDSQSSAPWFVFVPDGLRQSVTDQIAERLQIDASRVAPLTARCLIGLVFAAVVMTLSLRKSSSAEPGEFLRAGFLTLAWFWLLLPTQNPWYWIWAMPLIPFSGRRAWLAMSGVVLAYYLRFWFGYHWPDDQTVVWGHSGTSFFDFVVTWIEYVPWLLWLAFDKRRYCEGVR